MIGRRGFLAGGLVVLAGCGTSAAGNGYVAGDGSYTPVAPANRKPARVLSGTTVAGTSLTTSSYLGKVLVLNVWGSWCAPCRKEAPDLVAAADKTAEVAAFVGINTRDLDPAPARAFERAFGISYPSLYDPTGSLLLDLSEDLPPNAIPSTLVIDREGRVAARVVGTTTAATLIGIVTDVAEGR